MNRSLVALIITVSAIAFLTGCQAFKNHYNPIPQEVVQKVEAAAAAAIEKKKGEEKPAEETTKVDFTTDTTKCEHDTAIVVTDATDKGDGANDGWTLEEGEAESKVLAEKLGDFTTKITIKKSTEKLSFIVKQTAEKIYNVCGVIISGCVEECVGTSSHWTTVEKGSLEIYKFMKTDGEKVLNAGKYSFTFDKSNVGDEGKTVEGGYLLEKLGDPLTVE